MRLISVTYLSPRQTIFPLKYFNPSMTSADEVCILCKDPGTGINKNWVTYGKYIGGFFGLVSLGLISVALPFTFPAFRRFCLPYVPATDQQVKNILYSLKNRPNKGTLIDLGSGDGRVVSCSLLP